MNDKQAKAVDAVIRADLEAMAYDVLMYFTHHPRAAADGIEAGMLAWNMGLDFWALGQTVLDWYVWWLNNGADGLVEKRGALIFPVES